MKEWTLLLENLVIILWLCSVVCLFLMTAGNRKKNREIAEWVCIACCAIARYNNDNMVPRFRKLQISPYCFSKVPIVVYVKCTHVCSLDFICVSLVVLNYGCFTGTYVQQAL